MAHLPLYAGRHHPKHLPYGDACACYYNNGGVFDICDKHQAELDARLDGQEQP